MSWWCAASTKPWTWAPTIYLGVWLAMLGILAWYFQVVHRAHTSGRYSTTRRQKMLFVAGVLVLWVASDWPLGALGAGYLASAHMTQFVLYSVVATPLMMMGIPEPMFAAMLAKLRLTSASRFIAYPLVAALIFNITMVTTHSPPVTDLLRSSQIGSFVMDIFWVVAAAALWLPVISPVRSLRMGSYPGMMGYLFLSVGIVVIIPSAALLISAEPIYRTYELAPRVITQWSAVEDQQFAGVIMKLGATPIVWGTILALFIRWTNESGLSNKFGPKYRGRLVNDDGSVEPEWVDEPSHTSAGAPLGKPALSGARPGDARPDRSPIEPVPSGQQRPERQGSEELSPERLN